MIARMRWIVVIMLAACGKDEDDERAAAVRDLDGAREAKQRALREATRLADEAQAQFREAELVDNSKQLAASKAKLATQTVNRSRPRSTSCAPIAMRS